MKELSMLDIDFEKLIKKRKEWVTSSRENKFDFDTILAGLYSDPSHFIYELLQNAEDEKATEVKINLYEDRLDFCHNGKKFDIEDIKGVTGIGVSKKKGDLTLIGKFGVGFKSVFAVTQTPYIVSGEYAVKIEDFVVPAPIDKQKVNKPSIDETLIRLPFKHNKRTRDEIFKLTSTRLENLNLKTMLFLRNIKEIIWKTPPKEGHYLKEVTWIKPDKIRKVTVISSVRTEEYLIIENPIEIESKILKVEIAYKLGNNISGKEIIVPETDSRLVMYFPTEKVTFLNFVIQGPYKTTPNRENVPLEDKQNKAILNKTADLAGKSLQAIKDLGYLDMSFLNILPIKTEYKEKEIIYSVMYDKVKDELSDNELLPTNDDRYAKTNDVLLPKRKCLAEILDNADIHMLFNRNHWLNTDITQIKNQDLKNYFIKELGIPEIDFENFVKKITDEFLKRKSDDWIIRFYTELLNQAEKNTDIKSILMTKPIIRLESGEHLAPYNEKGEIQVYLPGETKSKYKTVKRSIIKDKNALKFLTSLELKKPGLFAEVKEFIIPKYEKRPSVKDNDYFDDLEKLYKVYKDKRISEGEKEKFKSKLSRIAFIDAVKSETGESFLKKPSEVYLKDNDLVEYFRGYSVWFVSDGIFEKFGEEINKFLEEMGTASSPRRISVKANLTPEEKSNLRKKTFSGDIFTKEYDSVDYKYEGLENFLLKMTPERSCLLWKLLLKSLKGVSAWSSESFFKGEYKWFYYSEHYAYFDAEFLKTLRQTAWLFDKNNNLKRPYEITFLELADYYIKENHNIDILRNVLEFKPEIIDRLPENDRRILEITRAKGITPEILEKVISESGMRSSTPNMKRWTPEYKPEDTIAEIKEIQPSRIVGQDLSFQAETESVEVFSKKTEKKEMVPGKEYIDVKAIGSWGEKYVYKALKKKYEKEGEIVETEYGFKIAGDNDGKLKVLWLNKNSDTGKGFDFIVKKGNVPVEYIEVKTKTRDEPELIEITGTQWEWARNLYNKNEGDRYFIYIVSNAGKKNANIKMIKNPVKLWMDGQLYAHPVNFKL